MSSLSDAYTQPNRILPQNGETHDLPALPEIPPNAALVGEASKTLSRRCTVSFILAKIKVVGRIKSYVVLTAYGFITCEVDGVEIEKELVRDRIAAPSREYACNLATLFEGQEVLFDLYLDNLNEKKMFRGTNLSAASGGLLLPNEEWLQRHDAQFQEDQIRKLRGKLERAESLVQHLKTTLELIEKHGIKANSQGQSPCMICKVDVSTLMFSPCYHIGVCAECGKGLKDNTAADPEAIYIFAGGRMRKKSRPPGSVNCPYCRRAGKLVKYHLV